MSVWWQEHLFQLERNRKLRGSRPHQREVLVEATSFNGCLSPWWPVATRQDCCFLVLPDDAMAFSSLRWTFPAAGMSKKTKLLPQSFLWKCNLSMYRGKCAVCGHSLAPGCSFFPKAPELTAASLHCSF